MYAQAPLTGPALHFSLDAPLPARLAVGGGTAVFVSGTCFCPTDRIRALAIVVDGDAQPVIAHGMPRLDFFARCTRPWTRSRWAGWTIDPCRSTTPGCAAIAVASGGWRGSPAAARDGCRSRCGAAADLGDAAGEAVARSPGASSRPLLPPPRRRRAATRAPLSRDLHGHLRAAADLLARQLDSIRAQTHGNWVCVISDDCSTPRAVGRRSARAVAGDPRFVVSRSPDGCGFYRNFERALALAPADAELRRARRPGRPLAPRQARDA